MKCKLTEAWHRSPKECKCVDQLHLNLNNKYCICFFSEPNGENDYCGDTWKIVDQRVAATLMRTDEVLEEFFEYV